MAYAIFPTIAPEERTRFRYLSGAFVCVAAAALVARAMGDAIFLSRFGGELLPYMYIGSALTIIAVSNLYSAGARRLATVPLIVASGGLLIAMVLSLRWALSGPWEGYRLAAYFLADLVVSLPMMLFWGFAALVFNPREGKRLIGMIGASGTAACIASGFLVRPLANRFGTENLLFGVAALLLGFVFAVVGLSRREPGRFRPLGAAPKSPPSRQVGYYTGLLRSRQIRSLAALMMVSTFSLFVVDFVFKSAARSRYQGAELAGFLGHFYGLANIASLLLQLFLVHRILQKGGVLMSLAVLPVGLILTSAGTAASLAFAWIVATKVMEPIFSFTINNAALQLLYLGIRTQTRSQARAFVEGMCRPLAIALAGTGLILSAGNVPLRVLALVVTGLGILWLWLSHRNNAAYIAGLIDSVGARRFEIPQDALGIHDKRLDQHLRQALQAASDEDIPYLLGVLPQLGAADATAELVELLEKRDSPHVKAAALESLRSHVSEQNLPIVLKQIENPFPEVRVAAVHTAAMVDSGLVIEALGGCLEDSDLGVRAAAAAQLINLGDLDGLLAGGAALREMFNAKKVPARIAATAALTYVRHAHLARLLANLLRDSETEVLRVALRATQSHPSPELVPLVLGLLADPRTGAVAADTLVAFGPTALGHLEALLGNPDPHELAARRRIPGIASRINDPKCLPILARALDDPDVELRTEAIQAMARFLKMSHTLRANPAALQASLALEIKNARVHRDQLAQVRGLAGAEVLAHALEDRYRLHLRNVFALLDGQIRNIDMNSIYHGLTRGASDKRAETLELLDNVLDHENRQVIVQLLEAPMSSDQVDRDQAEACVVQILTGGGSDWLVVGALYTAATAGLEAALEAAGDLLHHPSPVVRETALHAVIKLSPPQARQDAAAQMLGDLDPRVRKLATELASEG